MIRPPRKTRLGLLFSVLYALEMVASGSPAIHFPMDQTPVTGSLKITNAVTTNTAYWGSLAGSGLLPTLTNGATANTGNAWQFNTGYYLGVGANTVTKSLGDITNTPGLSVAFWLKYQNQTSDNWNRLCGLGANGEVFDFAIQNASAGVGQGQIKFTAGYQPDGTRWVDVQPANKVFDGNWHHIVGTVDFRTAASNAMVYVDGVAAKTSTAAIYHSFTNSGTLNIGARGNGTPWGGQIDQFIVYTNALKAAEVTQLYALGAATNYAPVVVVGAAKTSLIWTNGTTSVFTTLSAAITDDGLPNPPAKVTNLWTKSSGPYNVTFTYATNTNPTVTFTNTGSYVLRCTAGDGSLTDYDEVSVRVVTNGVPVVASWPSVNTLLSTNPTVVTLGGWVLDDGQPSPPGVTTSLWTRVSGPAAVTFANASSINTTVTIPTNIGSYVLRLTAGDTLLSGSNDVTISVVSNLSPTVAAWASQPILQWPSNTVSLQAVVSDDGRPNPPGAVTSLWSKVSGPGAVTFGNAATTNTTATFSVPGVYQLQIIASDTLLRATNTLYVNLWSNSVGTTPPVSVRPLSATPSPYEHPRIFFTKADRAELQARAGSDPVVQAALFGAAGLSNIVANTVDNPASSVGAAYARLSAGDTTLDTSALVTNNVDAANVFMTGNGGLYEPLADACYLAWLWPTNNTRLQQLATAVASAAVCHNQWWSLSVTPELNHDVYADLGFCYDLMYDWMAESQRGATRAFLSRITTNRHTIGWNEPDYSDSTNWRTHHDHLILAQLAIEGETGYDAVATTTNAASLKTFTTRWGITEGGFSREGTDYFSFGMRNAGLAAVALARRGENLFVTSRLYGALQESFYQMAPWGIYQFGHHDGAGWGNDTTGIGIYFRVMKYMYTNDALADCVLRNFQASPAGDNTPLATAIFGESLLSANTNFTVTAAAKDLDLTKFDAQRSLGIARSDWGSNAAQLEFDCRFDTMTLGHVHADRNNFVFFANGRTWIGDPGYHVEENDAHSTILIDGLGQSGTAISNHWPNLPGHFLEYRDQPAAVLFAGDATAAYSYFWDWATIGSGSGYQPDTSYLGTGKGVTTPWRWVDMMYAPPVDLSGANAWMTNYVRASNTYNAVLYAYRTTLFLRGTNSYALIVDDIQKDGNPHTYQWSANTIGVDPNSSFADPVADVSLVSAPDATNAVFYHTNDAGAYQPRLLVRVLDAKGTASPIQLLDETNALVTHLRRIAITRSNIPAPDFKVLLFPHLSGATLPTTTWSNNLLTVQMSDGQIDHIYFNTNADGRTRLQTYRVAGQFALAAVPSGLIATAGAGQITLSWSASAGATGYNLYCSTNSAGPFLLLAGNLASTNYAQSGLVAGVTNFYRVTALNPNGESETSILVTAAALVAPTSPPVIRSISLVDTNLIITGNNGTPGGNYLLLATTNLTTPLVNWTVLATNQFGPGGEFGFTIPMNDSFPVRFFRVK